MQTTFQAVDPERVLTRLEKSGIPQGTAAALIGLSGSGMSLFLSGKKGLSAAAQRDLLLVLRFLESLPGKSEYPVDFSAVEHLRPHWEEFKHARDGAEVVRLASEIDAQQ